MSTSCTNPGGARRSVVSHASGSASLDTGPPGHDVTWAHFASFSKLLGTSDNDTSGAFDGATCRSRVQGSTDIAGIVDQVKCTLSSSSVVVYVARFNGAAAVNTYVWTCSTTRTA